MEHATTSRRSSSYRTLKIGQRSIGIAIQAPQTLAGIRDEVNAWKTEYEKGPTPEQRETAEKRLAAADKTLRTWRKGQQVLTEEAQKDFDDLAEQIRVCMARIDIMSRTPSRKALPNPTTLAWTWCEKNVDKGTLLEAIKKTLPAYEKSVAAFHRAPSATALGDAESRLALVRKVLDAAKVHYAKNVTGPDGSAKARMSATLVDLAAKQAGVLAALRARLGDFDPVTAGAGAKQKLTDGRKTRLQAAQDERDALLKKAQDDHDNHLQQDTANKQSKFDLAKVAYDKAMMQAGDDPAAQATAKRRYDAALKNAQQFFDSGVGIWANTLATEKQKANQAFTVRAALGELSWNVCRAVVPSKTSLYKALESALPSYEAARATFEADPVAAAIQAALNALWDLQKAVQQALAKSEAEGKKLADALGGQLINAAEALPQLLRDEATLLQGAEAELPQTRMARAVMESDPSGGMLDAWVAELGGQAKTPEDKARVRAALKAKYGLDTLEGDMSTKALPRLFDVLGRVPLKQTGGNESLKMVVRSRSDFVPSGFYDGDEQKMQLDVGRTGRSGLTKELFNIALPYLEKPPGGWKGSGLKKPKSSDIFDHLTLHEIGHSVDDQMDFMGKRMGNSAYGNWKRITPREVRDLACNGKGFIGSFPDLPKNFLTGYLDAVIGKKDPQKDTELANMLVGKTADWSALAKHEAVRFCKAVRLGDGAITEVTQWDKKAKEALHEGHVYQQAYDNDSDWYSYDVGARARGIGGYQFRAPGEWFAEIYATYYGGRLKSSHPDYAWMQALVDTDQ